LNDSYKPLSLDDKYGLLIVGHTYAWRTSAHTGFAGLSAHPNDSITTRQSTVNIT
jgi:hypothetical protein